jgi:ankyrin repeat protein
VQLTAALRGQSETLDVDVSQPLPGPDGTALPALHLAALHGDVPLLMSLLSSGAVLDEPSPHHQQPQEVEELRDPTESASGDGAALRGRDAGPQPAVSRLSVAGTRANVDRSARSRAPSAATHSDPRGPASSLGAATTDGGQVGRASVDDEERALMTHLDGRTSDAGSGTGDSGSSLSGDRVDTLSSRGGLTPLMVAIRAGNEHCARLLLSYGASVSRTDASGMAPLHHAAAAPMPAVIPLLLATMASGHDHDPRDYHDDRGPFKRVHRFSRCARGWTPLMWAASTGNVAAVVALLRGGAWHDADRCDADAGTTRGAAMGSHAPHVAGAAEMEQAPVHVSLGAQFGPAAARLERKGVLPAGGAVTPMALAMLGNHTSVIAVLEAYNTERSVAGVADSGNPGAAGAAAAGRRGLFRSRKLGMHAAVRDADLSSLTQQLVQRAGDAADAPVAPLDEHSRTPLHLAALLNAPAAVEVILGAGIDPSGGNVQVRIAKGADKSVRFVLFCLFCFVLFCLVFLFFFFLAFSFFLTYILITTTHPTIRSTARAF